MVDMKELPFIFYFIPDFDGETGRLIFAINHAFTDAAGIIPIMVAMDVNPDFKSLIKLSPPPFWAKFLHAFISPISMIELGLEVLSIPTANNCMKKPTSAHKNRRALMSDAFLLSDVKKQCKKYKCTMNDACLGFLG